eukprot:m.145331 g.145331  ORF g.145331 m.145331 type:complete len:505 (+) comp17732_c0_seq2:509-2023(+)
MPMMEALSTSDKTGIPVHMATVLAYIQTLRHWLRDLRVAAHRLSPWPFSLNSTKQTQDVLRHQDWGCGDASTAEEHRKVVRQIVSVWRRVRCEYSKLLKIAAHSPTPAGSRTTHADIVHIPPVVNPFSVNGRVFYKGCSVSHVAKIIDIPLALRHAVHAAADGTSVHLRRIVRAPKGKSIVCFDYKQFECRVLAHMCKDARLDNVLRQTDVDPFVTIANILFPPRGHIPNASVTDAAPARVLIGVNSNGIAAGSSAHGRNIPVDVKRRRTTSHRACGAASGPVQPSEFEARLSDVTHRRNLAKTLMYGIMNGMGATGIADKAQLSVPQARKVLTAVFRAFPKMRQYTAVVRTDAARSGCVKTICGRRRFLTRCPDLEERERARTWQREAVNGVIQGSASDIVKIALARLARRECGLASLPPPALVLVMHDELIFEVKNHEGPATIRVIKRCMESAAQQNVPGLTMPFPVRVSIGKTWGDVCPVSERTIAEMTSIEDILEERASS